MRWLRMLLLRDHARARPIPLIASGLLVVLGFGSVGRAWAHVHPHLVGAVSEVDVVGKGIEVQTTESSGRSHHQWFRIADSTEIRSRGHAGSIADLRPGEQVVVTWFPARLPHTAERVEVR